MAFKKILWNKWILNYSVGELCGIGVAAVVGRLLFINFPSSATSFLTVLLLMIAGTLEGLILGYIQWKSLSKLSTHISLMPWIYVTTFSTLAGWLLILPPGVMFIAVLAEISLITTSKSIFFTMLVGAAFGGIIGFPQYFIVKRYFRNAEVWIVTCALGWAISFLVFYSALLLFNNTNSYLQNVVLIALSCIASGFVQGFTTGTVLHFFMPAKSNEQ